MADALFAPGHLFPDGYYRLKETVLSPLPARLSRARRRSRGWARPRWDKGTEFKVESSLMVTVEFIGSTPKLSARQRDAVARALTAQLEPIPTLPRHILRDEGGDAEDTLDALFALGVVTLDDVRRADLTMRAVGALNHLHLSELCVEPPAPAAAPAQTLAGLRVGDVVYDRTSADPDHYTVLEVLRSDMYLWQRCAANATPFPSPWERHREPVFGHVGDLIAEGLAALALRTSLGADYDGNDVCPGDVLVHKDDDPDDSRVMRLRVVDRAPGDSAGPRVTFVQLGGSVAAFDTVSLKPGNQWRVVRTQPIGLDRNGKAVHCGDVLVSEAGTTRVRVVGRGESVGGEPCALFVQLSGPLRMDVNVISLGPHSKWTIQDAAPPVRHGNFGKPAPETHDPFSLD
jgi:hypothetical protein